MQALMNMSAPDCRRLRFYNGDAKGRALPYCSAHDNAYWVITHVQTVCRLEFYFLYLYD